MKLYFLNQNLHFCILSKAENFDLKTQLNIFLNNKYIYEIKLLFNNMDIRMRALLPTLVMISKINPGEKLIVRSKYISVDLRWGQWYRRLWDGEGRERTLERLIEIYSEIRQKVSLILYEMDSANDEKKYEINDTTSYPFRTRNLKELYRTLQSVANALGKSHKGIKNLITTYSDDSHTVSMLESIMDNDIKDIYREISNALPEIYKPEVFIFDTGVISPFKPRNEHILSQNLVTKKKEK